MIITESFPGDHAEDVKDVQNDAYGDAVGLIASRASNAYLFACRVLDVSDDFSDALFEKRGHFDHRDVQDLHDILAAIWRYSTSRTDPALPFPELAPERVLEEWMSWLSEQLDFLETEVIWVRSVAQAGAGLRSDPIGERLRPALEIIWERYRHLAPFLDEWHAKRFPEHYE
ncbi:hypothetical protein ACWCOP_12775 [Maricaulaceae bacterium MS644]